MTTEFIESEPHVNGNHARAQTTEAFAARFHSRKPGVGLRVGHTMTILDDDKARIIADTITRITGSRTIMHEHTLPVVDDLGNTVHELNLNDPLRAAIRSMGDSHPAMVITALASVEDFPDEYKTLALANTIAHLAGALDEALKHQDADHSDMRAVILRAVGHD